MHVLFSSCPRCGHQVKGAFPSQCPACDFNVSVVAGKGTTDFQRRKWNEHSDLLQGRDLQLYGKEYNASFDYRGSAALTDLARFALTYGDRVEIPTNNRPNSASYIVTYVPEIIGSGTVAFQPGTVPCSGIALVSPHSLKWGHPMPTIDDWVQKKFAGRASSCRLCGVPTAFAQPICANCYAQYGDWRSLLGIDL